MTIGFARETKMHAEVQYKLTNKMDAAQKTGSNRTTILERSKENRFKPDYEKDAVQKKVSNWNKRKKNGRSARNLMKPVIVINFITCTFYEIET
ncbi:hypothetical protein SK128_026036, partial [Halocaridina rubra]